MLKICTKNSEKKMTKNCAQNFKFSGIQVYKKTEHLLTRGEKRKSSV